MTDGGRQKLRHEKSCRSFGVRLLPCGELNCPHFPSGLLCDAICLDDAGVATVMLWEIGRVWHFSRGQDALAIAGNLFGALGAIATGLVVWLGFLTAGIWLPYVGSFKGAAGLFSLTWMLGQSTNQYYAIGYRRQLLRKVKYASS